MPCTFLWMHLQWKWRLSGLLLWGLACHCQSIYKLDKPKNRLFAIVHMHQTDTLARDRCERSFSRSLNLCGQGKASTITHGYLIPKGKAKKLRTIYFQTQWICCCPEKLSTLTTRRAALWFGNSIWKLSKTKMKYLFIGTMINTHKSLSAALLIYWKWPIASV